jgi:hypothetical protein
MSSPFCGSGARRFESWTGSFVIYRIRLSDRSSNNDSRPLSFTSPFLHPMHA